MVETEKPHKLHGIETSASSPREQRLQQEIEDWIEYRLHSQEDPIELFPGAVVRFGKYQGYEFERVED